MRVRPNTQRRCGHAVVIKDFIVSFPNNVVARNLMSGFIDLVVGKLSGIDAVVENNLRIPNEALFEPDNVVA